MGRKGVERREEEEGAGTPGSPRIVSVPRAPVVAQPGAGAGSPRQAGAPPPMAHYTGGATSTTSTTTVDALPAVTTQPIPVSTRAVASA